jgi:hypothetical protein
MRPDGASDSLVVVLVIIGAFTLLLRRIGNSTVAERDRAFLIDALFRSMTVRPLDERTGEDLYRLLQRPIAFQEAWWPTTDGSIVSVRSYAILLARPPQLRTYSGTFNVLLFRLADSESRPNGHAKYYPMDSATRPHSACSPRWRAGSLRAPLGLNYHGLTREFSRRFAPRLEVRP